MGEAIEVRERLLTTLEKARRSIRQVRDGRKHISEAQTKASLINPVLQALGWDMSDLDEVALEYRHKPQDNPVDYALLSQQAPRLFVEAKALGTNLDDHKWVSQVVNYANAAGVAWCVLTDGDQYCIYNTHAPVALEEKLFRAVAVSELSAEDFALDTLELLSKEHVAANAIEGLWKPHFVDRSVEKVLSSLFGGVDESLVRLVGRRAGQLTAAEIRDSLRRAKLRVEFPGLVPGPPTAVPAPSSGGQPIEGPKSAAAPRHGVTVTDLLAAGLVSVGDRWQGSGRNGVRPSAEVTADGGLLVDGVKYTSPSGAAKAATGWKSADGWAYWWYEDPSGSMQPIAVLLRQVLSAATVSTEIAPSPPQAPASVERHLAGKPVSAAIYEVLLERTRQAVGDFAVHANSKHIVFTNRSAFLVISAGKHGLRFGLRLDAGALETHPRLAAQPRGTFEGWSALHVSATVSNLSEVDDELISLIVESARNAG